MEEEIQRQNVGRELVRNNPPEEEEDIQRRSRACSQEPPCQRPRKPAVNQLDHHALRPNVRLGDLQVLHHRENLLDLATIFRKFLVLPAQHARGPRRTLLARAAAQHVDEFLEGGSLRTSTPPRWVHDLP